ncbi:hypothetical protein HZS61_008986 [Fusarium oxysporum f. sp. conglutinans]|uniref:HTH CENPB-type domain-containing protein n=1 Tax=Fusarium oxysporum f. sp. conglutinans TaxID=100902 RepID=A0A8H6H2T0_FUSOX|nr:hypothetical protein HZS61_008986 [Fusarium oxysporum f. sp. conglutinans]
MLVAVAKDEKGQEVIAGIAQWARLGDGGQKLECWKPSQAFIFYAMNIHAWAWPNRASDPKQEDIIERAYPHSKTYGRRNVGRKLVQWGLEQAKTEGICASVVSAFGTEEFYKKCGFDEQYGSARQGEGNPLADIEEIIVKFILDLDSRGFPPRLRGVEEMANRLLADRDASPVGKRWAMNFVKRHKELKTRFFSLVENTIAKYGIRSDNIWNFDETGFMMGVIASGMVVTGAERRGKPKSVQPGNREWINVIQAINAEGRAIPPFIIGSGQYHLANWYREKQPPRRLGYCNIPKWLD